MTSDRTGGADLKDSQDDLDTLLGDAPDSGTVPPSMRPGWVVLTRSGQSDRLPREPNLKRALLQLGVIAAVVITAVVFVGGLISRRLSEDQAVHEVARLTNVLADSVVQPALTDSMATSTTAAARLDPLVRTRVLSSSLVRVKIWTLSGRIVYSDEKRLVGAQFGLDGGARQAISDAQVQAEITDLSDPENRFERGRGSMLEVYRPVWTPNGTALLFETYFRYDQVTNRTGALWRDFALILAGSILVIVVLLVPVVWSLVARARRARRQREQMLRRSMEASQDERRRIAATLHDGVVQELAAAAFSVSGSAQEAAARGDTAMAQRLDEVGDVVRSGIGGMRSLLVDIYPASLHSAGLAPALRDLAQTVRVPVQVDADDDAAATLSREQEELVFRVAQESLRNAAKHADARLVTVRLAFADDQDSDVVQLDIVDDGVGFDPLTTKPTGHFGLALMTDLAHGNGAELAVRSAPGEGTQWRLRCRT